MPLSQNGFTASTDPGSILVGQFTVPGTSVSFPGGIASFAAPLLIWVAQQIHEQVEPLHAGWCWGFNYRPVTGQNSVISNHASGTAIDVNAPAHPRGQRGTWSHTKLTKIRAILAEANRDAHVVSFGEDFPTPDGMHLEARGTRQQVIDAGKRLTRGDWFDMATKADLIAAVREALPEATLQRIAQEAVQAELGNGGAKIWDHQLADPSSTATPPRTYSAGAWLRGRDSVIAKIVAALKTGG